MPAQDINTDRLLVACVISVGSITSFSEDVRSMVMVKGQWNRSGDDIPWWIGDVGGLAYYGQVHV